MFQSKKKQSFVIVRARCENRHEQKFTVASDLASGLCAEDRRAYWADFVALMEYSSNESVGSKGCLNCGGRVSVTVENKNDA